LQQAEFACGLQLLSHWTCLTTKPVKQLQLGKASAAGHHFCAAQASGSQQCSEKAAAGEAWTEGHAGKAAGAQGYL